MTDNDLTTCTDLGEDIWAFKLRAKVTPVRPQFNVTLKMEAAVSGCGDEQVSAVILLLTRTTCDGTSLINYFSADC